VGLAAGDGQSAPEAIISRADEALYQAKREGRNQLAMFSEGTIRLYS
jgi:PleD family two-component response regulator